MRSKDRIDSFMMKLQEVWEQYFPDWRFGQLMYNFLAWGMEKHGDFYYWEEYKFLKYLNEYLEEGHSPFFIPANHK